MIIMEKKYKIIYADPSWKYQDKGCNGNCESHYPTMSIEDLCNLPIRDITDDDCVLFMWATYPNLKEAFEVIEAWGFKYKTVAFTWVKKNKKSDSYFTGLGYWTRANPEICLLATKGKPKRISKGVRNLVVSRIREHSRKPDEVRDRIVELMGDIPRIELFAREGTEGWDVWGNETTKFNYI